MIVAMFGAVAQGQDIAVLEDGGHVVDVDSRTVLEFRSEDHVPIHRVLSTTTMSGYNVSGYGETTERLCASPCRIEVPSGHYRLRVDDNLVLGKRLDIDATGEPLAWEVRRAHPARYVVALLGTTAGISGLSIGGAMLALDEPQWKPVAAWSAGVTIGSIYLFDGARARARPVRP